ncbi:MAG TPA: hypothetical protein VN724_14540 [Pyrinomonadaceae bacterium]|nr:hypothetical protein [Pyrinomonadaceae bacterium]
MIKSKLNSWTFIFVLAAVIFCTVNFISYYLKPEYSTLADGFTYFGWPFRIYYEGGFAGTRGIILTGLIGNLVLALGVSRVLVKLATDYTDRIIRGR